MTIKLDVDAQVTVCGMQELIDAINLDKFSRSDQKLLDALLKDSQRISARLDRLDRKVPKTK